jgi:hypothetical protein
MEDGQHPMQGIDPQMIQNMMSQFGGADMGKNKKLQEMLQKMNNPVTRMQMGIQDMDTSKLDEILKDIDIIR